MDWLTLEWLMKNLEWAVGLLAVGCLILFLFPVFLGYDLKKKAEKHIYCEELDSQEDTKCAGGAPCKNKWCFLRKNVLQKMEVEGSLAYILLI